MSANKMNVNDLRVLAGAVFNAINDEANKNGIEQVIIAVRYDVIDDKTAKTLNWPTDRPLVVTSPPGRPAQTAREKIVSAEIVFRNAYYGLKPSSNIMDYSSEACPNWSIKTKGGIYIPIGTVSGEYSTIWHTEVGVGIGVETGNPDTDKDLAMSGARVACDYFEEHGFLYPEVFRREN